MLWQYHRTAVGEPAETDPRGVRLRGARVVGQLDLESVSTNRILQLRECYVPDGVIARDATVGVLRMDRCRLDRPTLAQTARSACAGPAPPVSSATAQPCSTRQARHFAPTACGAVGPTSERLRSRDADTSDARQRRAAASFWSRVSVSVAQDVSNVLRPPRSSVFMTSSWSIPRSASAVITAAAWS
jgi:hypothetical protein